uniref:Uncharacterized protein n=1 Tax=Leptospira santarosai serovar Arenal str. MAVJ 401 TaxID=1049976 RepID=M6JRR1_9LEPT|nr:hypothetical protein LEP1GSC063_3285 [Leptospira santarosai serovar Arenal str. MAVJ 401]
MTRKDFKTIPVIESNIQFKKKFRLETRYRQKTEIRIVERVTFNF